MKRYYNFLIILQPQNKVVQDVVVHMTEEEMHENCAKIALGLEEKGLSFNGKNAKRYYDFVTRDITDEYPKVRDFLKARGF